MRLEDLPDPRRIPGGTRLYLRPAVVLPRSDPSAADARLLAATLLAALRYEVILRTPEGAVVRADGAPDDVEAWANDLPEPLHARFHILRDRLHDPQRPPAAPALMAILNVTPDSFSDGGLYASHRAAIAHGRALAEAGADLVDIGGESTRPGAEPVPPDEEIRRVLPVVEGLAADGLAVSIDTRHAAVMRAATEAGAVLINDVSALTTEPESLEVAAASGARIALMHMQGDPRTMQKAPHYRDVALDVFDALEARVEACRRAGIARERLIVDPGISFGKNEPHNLELLRALALFLGLGCPLMLGISRKGWTQAVQAQRPPIKRLPASLAAAQWGLDRGVSLLRVHDVAEHRQMLDAWRSLID